LSDDNPDARVDRNEVIEGRKTLRGKLQTIAVLVALMAIIGGSIHVYRNFHHRHAWIERSPTNSGWAVDIALGGWQDISQIFRVHDRKVSPLRPVMICDLYWEHRHWPHKLHWSRDGSVAAIIVIFAGSPEELYGCAYDFREHKAYASASSSPLEPSPQLSDEIRQLLAARGGVGKRLDVPDASHGGFE